MTFVYYWQSVFITVCNIIFPVYLYIQKRKKVAYYIRILEPCQKKLYFNILPDPFI